MERRAFLAGSAALLAAPLAAAAEQAEKVYRVGYLASSFSSGAGGVLMASFGQGMRELGYVQGRNLVLAARFAEGKLERLPLLAQELIRLNPDVLFVATTPGSLAAKAATPSAIQDVGSQVVVKLVKALGVPVTELLG